MMPCQFIVNNDAHSPADNFIAFCFSSVSVVFPTAFVLLKRSSCNCLFVGRYSGGHLHLPCIRTAPGIEGYTFKPYQLGSQRSFEVCRASAVSSVTYSTSQVA